MSILQQATKSKIRPPILTIIGSKGTGKSTLAGLFPSAVFIRGEDGSSVFEDWEESIQPYLLPQLITQDSPRMNVLHTIGELLTTEHSFETLVIDTINTMNTLFERELAKRDGVTNVIESCGGFQKCFDELKMWNLKIFEGCERLRNEKNMSIVFLSHSIDKKIKNSPDENSDYVVWAIDMHAKPASVYLNGSDGVYYLTKEAFIVGAEVNKRTGATTKYGRKTESGNRVLITSGDGKTGYIDAKDRYKLPAEIPVEHGENPLLKLISFYTTNTQA